VGLAARERERERRERGGYQRESVLLLVNGIWPLMFGCDSFHGSLSVILPAFDRIFGHREDAKHPACVACYLM
jgi:hypothetical protein